MFSIDPTIARLLAERDLNLYKSDEWATMCLEAGFDSKHLRMLAATLPQDWPSEVDDIERKAVAELGWEKIPRYEYLLEYARLIASGILQGRHDPIDGSGFLLQLMYEAELHDHLGAWHEIGEMIGAQSSFASDGYKDYFYVEPEELKRIIFESCKQFLVETRPKTAPLPETSFEEAEVIFREFLANNGLPEGLVWVFADDLIIRFKELQIRVPLPEGNREAAKAHYDSGVHRKLGVAIHAFAKLEDQLLVYVQLPSDKIDADRMLLSEYFVKFSVSTLRYKVRSVESPIIWWIKNLFTDHAKRIGYEDIPFRSSL